MEKNRQQKILVQNIPKNLKSKFLQMRIFAPYKNLL